MSRMRRRLLSFSLQGLLDLSRSRRRCRRSGRFLAASISARSLFSRLPRSLSFLGWRQFHSRPPSLRESDGDRLLRRASPMLAFPNMLHFLPNEFSGLRGRGFAFSGVFSCSFKRILFRHYAYGLDLYRV